MIQKDIGLAVKHVKVIRQIAKYLLEKKASITQVLTKANELQTLISETFWSNASVKSLEDLREEVRELMQFLDREHHSWIVDIPDEVEDREDIETEFASFDIRTYREKVIDYLAEHSDSEVIVKIKNLEPITNEDLAELQRILWEELGTEEDYHSTTNCDNVAAFVRSLVGLDQNTINERFGDYLNGNKYNFQQQEFIKAIIDYVKENGDISREDLIEKAPFDSYDLITLFGDNVMAVLDVVNTLHNSIRLAA